MLGRKHCLLHCEGLEFLFYVAPGTFGFSTVFESFFSTCGTSAKLQKTHDEKISNHRKFQQRRRAAEETELTLKISKASPEKSKRFIRKRQHAKTRRRTGPQNLRSIDRKLKLAENL